MSKNKTTRTREELVAECAAAAAACWNHYADLPLSSEQEATIRDNLDGLLPALVTTRAWTNYAEEKQAEREEQRKEEAENG